MIKISKDISLAADLLNNENVIGFPTETVYGLAGNIFSKKAIDSIFEIKQRPRINPLIVHISKVEDLYKIANEIPENALKLANAFWPGPLTLLLKKNDSIPDYITAGKDSVAVRIPNHKLALKILNAIDFPLAAPSANPFGMISPTTANHVAEFFPTQIKAVFDGGACENGIESTIVGFQVEKVIVYRLGAISIEDIEAIVGKTEQFTSDNKTPIAPGMMKKHYAPKTNFILTDSIENEIVKHINLKIGILTFNKNYDSGFIKSIEILSTTSNFKEASKKLYAAMHRLDKQNLDLIIAEKFPDYDLGKSINDRLTRAAEK
jgi:L-threonylcarbamoyladenylate synthase